MEGQQGRLIVEVSGKKVRKPTRVEATRKHSLSHVTGELPKTVEEDKQDGIDEIQKISESAQLSGERIDEELVELGERDREYKGDEDEVHCEDKDFILIYDGVMFKLAENKHDDGRDAEYEVEIKNYNGDDNALPYYAFNEKFPSFAEALEVMLQTMGNYQKALDRTSKGFGKLIDKISQGFLEGKVTLTNEELESMKKQALSEKVREDDEINGVWADSEF